MKNILLLAASALLATGCATAPVKSVDSARAAALRDQSFGFTERPRHDFLHITLGKALGGALGGIIGAVVAEAADSRTGGPWRNVADPGLDVTKTLSAALVADNGLKPAAGKLTLQNGDKVADIVAASRGRVKYMLDVETTRFGTSYFPSDWTHYQVHYQANARLIDVDAGVVIASATCKDVEDDKASAPDYATLMASNAALLKEKLAGAARDCALTLKQAMLKI